jgi:hypothetical protein
MMSVDVAAVAQFANAAILHRLMCLYCAFIAIQHLYSFRDSLFVRYTGIHARAKLRRTKGK